MIQASHARRADRPRVALIVSPATAFARGTLLGVRAFLREHNPWTIFLAEQGVTQTAESLLADWKPDGVIARLENDRLRGLVDELGDVPVVEVSGHHEDDPHLSVRSDDRAIGAMGADHLLGLGYRRFGFVEEKRYHWSRKRKAGFLEALAAADAHGEVFDRSALTDAGLTGAKQHEALMDWLRGLPEMSAVMACNDILGQQVIEAAHGLKLSVPDELSVLGVDDDDLLCDLTDPPLSSVAPDTFRIGYTAAQSLDALMRGEDPGQRCFEVEPLTVTRRRSTDSAFVEDVTLVKAMAYIREHACDGITVRDVVRQVPLTRRMLDARFIKQIGRSPYEEILRIKINRACVLLTETTLTLAQIARYSGFKEAECLNVAFKRSVGQTPGQYRTTKTTGLLSKRQNCTAPSR